MSLLKLEDITVAFDGQTVLHDVELSLAAGEIVTIVGPNGSGKSTLLKLIVGAVTASSGTVWRKAGLRMAMCRKN